MTHDDDGHQWSLCNPGPEALSVWLEPWADEFEIPAKSTIFLRGAGLSADSSLGEIENTADHIVIWASAQTVEVFVDGVRQESGSATIPIPEGLTKGMLSILFTGRPAARLGGAPADIHRRISWWQRMKDYLGLQA